MEEGKKIITNPKINYVRYVVMSIIVLLIIVVCGIGLIRWVQIDVNLDYLVRDKSIFLDEDISGQLVVNWDVVGAKKPKDVTVKIGQDTYVLEKMEDSIVVPIEELDQKIRVSINSPKRRFNVDVSMNKYIVDQLGALNFYQKVISYSEDGENIIIEHFFKKSIEYDIDFSNLTYEVFTLAGETVDSIVPTVLEETEEYLRAEVKIPLYSIIEENLLTVMLNYEVAGVKFQSYVRDFDMNVEVLESDYVFNPKFQQQNMVLLNQKADFTSYQSHNFFAESVHFDIKESIKSYQLIKDSDVGNEEVYYIENNKGVSLRDLSEGSYIVLLNQRPVYVEDELYDVWYTVKRDGFSKRVIIESCMGLLSIKIEYVENVPDNVYDILIDAGHGGFDSGAVSSMLVEAEETLRISEYIAARLSEYGLKVKMSRVDNSDPSGNGISDYKTAPYNDNGRVEQVYRYKANYVISNHLNALDGKQQGFELYSSILTTNRWTELISEEFKLVGQFASDSLVNNYRVEEGSYKKYYTCVPSEQVNSVCVNSLIDYLYVIRETGGYLTQSAKIVQSNDLYYLVPNYGAETILVEYVYLDNVEDAEFWNDNWKRLGEAVVRATLRYLDIK